VVNLVEIEKVTRLGLLIACYGILLTPKQQKLMHLYYDHDLSLGEIAEELGISRQAVYDHLKRAVASLEDYEAKLGLAERYQHDHRLLTTLRQKMTDLTAIASRYEDCPELLRLCVELKMLVDQLGAALDN